MCWHPGGRGWPRNPSHRDQHQCCPSAPLTLCLSWFLWMLRAEMLTRIPGCNITWHCTHARQHWAASQSWSQVRTGQFIIAVYHEAWMKDFYDHTDERPGRPRQQLSSVWTLGRAYHLLDWIKKSRNQPQSRTINMDQSGLSLEVTRMQTADAHMWSHPVLLHFRPAPALWAQTGSNKILRPARDCNARHQGSGSCPVLSVLILMSSDDLAIIQSLALFKHLPWEQ